jgi:Putative Flp pilus-assembly TadE/G-like
VLTARRPRRRRRGTVAPLTVLTLTLLVGMVAIAVDGGALLEDRRHVQAAADAAALAAAADLYANYANNNGADHAGRAARSALDTAAANGFGNDGVNSVVTVTVAPGRYQGGPNAGQPLWTPGPDTVHALNLHSNGAVSVGAFSSLKVNGPLRVNSDSVTAIVVGLGGTISALVMILNALLSGLLGLLLGLLGLGGGGSSVKYVPPLPDPLRYLAAPDPVALGLPNQGTNLTINSGTVQLHPGVYTGGLNIGGTANVTLHANADGTPGLYILQGGGLNVSGSATVTTSPGEPGGIMVFNAWSLLTDAISINSTGNVTLTPPNTGPYKGLTLFQARGSLTTPGPTISLTGYAGTKITGTVYGAHAPCRCHGSGGCVLGGQQIVDSLSVTGAVNVDASGKPVANTRQVGLVE